ncbi:MAG: sigma-70 family RNA polymerase sigma factor, partial [Verrucomicrobiota bacterium]|nr:sigma-70 family RNA polymerase sigma factor [Verrucomicrobiota bacterium]
MKISDLDLLREYSEQDCEEAFATVVKRHLDLVYSAALRQVRAPQLAEEVAQSVFTDLSRSVDKMKPDTLLTAWLYRVTRHTAIDVVRKESRRQHREQTSVEMAEINSSSAEWKNIAPLLDEAMETLEEKDRSAILLRYFENKSLGEVGQTLGTSEDAAQKR